MFVSRAPVRVWLNRSLFPIDLISIAPFQDKVLRDFRLGYGFGNEILKLDSGDGEDLGPIGRGKNLDLFISPGNSSFMELPSLQFARLLPMPPGRSLLITASWVDSNDQSRRMCIAWSHLDRLRGHRPRLAFDQKADTLATYAHHERLPITGPLLELRHRVPVMRSRDARTRARMEEKSDGVDAETKVQVRTQSISVSGFRGFREEAELRLAYPNGSEGSGLTIVVGANNTGKSTIWESFEAIARKLQSDVSFTEGRRNRKSPDGIQITLRRTDHSSYVVASQNAETSETTGVWQEGNGEVPPEIVTVPSRRQFQASFSKHADSRRDWMIGRQEFSRQRQIDDGFTGRLFDLHNNPSKKADFDKLMTEVVDYPLRWTIDLGDGQHGQSYYLKVTTDESVNHTSEGLGDGIISLLFVLNALYDSEPETLLVLDEPELSLHPQLVRRLGRIFARYAASRQIVIFTHSPLLVSWDDVENGAEIARVYKVAGDSRIAQVPRSTVDELSKARGGWKNPHVLGSDATEALFLDDEIIVVEGQEDAGLLPKIFHHLELPQRGTIFGWGTGGGDRNPERIVALLDGLGFSKVVTLLDGDKTAEAKRIQDRFPDYFATTIPADDIRDKPPHTFEGKVGLLDENGGAIKPEWRAETYEVLSSVRSYFAESAPT